MLIINGVCGTIVWMQTWDQAVVRLWYPCSLPFTLASSLCLRLHHSCADIEYNSIPSCVILFNYHSHSQGHMDSEGKSTGAQVPPGVCLCMYLHETNALKADSLLWPVGQKIILKTAMIYDEMIKKKFFNRHDSWINYLYWSWYANLKATVCTVGLNTTNKHTNKHYCNIDSLISAMNKLDNPLTVIYSQSCVRGVFSDFHIKHNYAQY